MVDESGLKLRTRLQSAKTLRAATDATTTHSAGDMVVVGDTIGIVVEDAPVSSFFVLVYEAEKVVVPKATGVGESFEAGDAVYFDDANGVITATTTDNTKCGIALEAAGTSDDQALIDLVVLG